MLAIKSQDIFFDLYPNTTISLELNNSIFGDDFLHGNYSFPFKIPLTPKNRQLLNFPDEIGSIVNFNQAFIVDLYVEDLLLFPAGELHIKTVFDTNVECFILVGISTFAQYANTTKIAQVTDFVKEMSGAIQGIDSGWDPLKDIRYVSLDSLSHDVDSLPYIFFPVINDNHYERDKVNFSVEGANNTKQNVIYNYYENSADFLALSYTQSEWEATPFSMCPFFYATYVLRQIFRNIKAVNNIFETDAELKTLCVLNNFSLDLWRDVDPDHVYWTNTSGRNIEAKNHVPDMYISEFLLALKKIFCLYIHQNPFSNEVYFDSLNNILDDNTVTDWTRITAPKMEVSQDTPAGIKYTPKANNDGILSNTASMQKEHVIGTGVHQSDLPTAGMITGDVWFVQSIAKYFKWTGDAWEILTDGYSDFYVAPSSYEVAPDLTGAVEQDFGVTHKNFCATISTSGSYLKRDNTTVVNPNVMKLVFYRGMSPVITGYGYSFPFASSNNFFADESKHGNYSLTFPGAYGLYETWWKKYLNFRANVKIVKYSVYIDLVTLLSLDLRKKIRIAGNHFFIRKITLQLPLQKAAEVEFWKVGGAEMFKIFEDLPAPVITTLRFSFVHSGSSFLSFSVSLDAAIAGDINISRMFADGFATAGDCTGAGSAIASAQFNATGGNLIIHAGELGNSHGPEITSGTWTSATVASIYNVFLNGTSVINGSSMLIGTSLVNIVIQHCS